MSEENGKGTASAVPPRVNKNAWLQKRLHRAKVRHAYIDRDAVGRPLCSLTGFEPPKQPANQKRCKAVIDRVEKEIAAADAARAKAEAKW